MRRTAARTCRCTPSVLGRISSPARWSKPTSHTPSHTPPALLTTTVTVRNPPVMTPVPPPQDPLQPRPPGVHWAKFRPPWRMRSNKRGTSGRGVRGLGRGRGPPTTRWRCWCCLLWRWCADPRSAPHTQEGILRSPCSPSARTARRVEIPRRDCMSSLYCTSMWQRLCFTRHVESYTIGFTRASQDTHQEWVLLHDGEGGASRPPDPLPSDFQDLRCAVHTFTRPRVLPSLARIRVFSRRMIFKVWVSWLYSDHLQVYFPQYYFHC